MDTPRRTFLGALAAGGAVWAGSTPADQTPRPLRLGVIGMGWYGMVDAKAALKAGSAEIAAICDIDREHLDKSAADLHKLQGRRPQTFKRYEELLASPGLDAVIIATPPQWHALQFIAAVEKGLDVYCEKPLAYDLRESRSMVNAAAQSGRVVQVGFQRRQSPAYRAVKEFIASGAAGTIVQVDAQIHYTAATKDTRPQDPPASLDWDLWCGPGPKIPYAPQVGHHSWRLEKTSGHGHLVDWGIHLIDAVRVILGESVPRRVTAVGGLYALKGKITTPDTLTAHFEFARCPVVWRHRIWGAEEYTPETSNGLFFYGDKATVFVSDDRWVVIPKGKNAVRQEHKAKAEAGLLHMTEFLAAVRARRAPSCTIADAHASTTAVKLAMISYETGTTVVWDAQRETIVDNPAAVKLLKRDYRPPWKHPG